MGQHTDAIAELEHEVGAGHDVGVAAPHLDEDCRLAPGQVEVGERPAHHARAGGEDAQVVEVAAIREQPSVGRLAEAPPRLLERVLAGADREHDVVFGDHDAREAASFRPARRSAAICTPAGRAALTSPSVLPDSAGLRSAISSISRPLAEGASIRGLSTRKKT